MNTTKKILTIVLAVMMLASILPLQAFAATYNVYLHCGPEGWGSTAWPLTKTSGVALPLCHDKSSIHATYGMLPGYYVLDDQRTFIEWNTAYNSTTGRGTGTSYYDYYTKDVGDTLYAIWGYNIQFNADGGTFPDPTSGNDIYLTYVADYNLEDQTDPKTDYSYCMPDVFGNTPTKSGCRRVQNGDKPSYALLYADLRFFCWETPDQNLTIPPTGGYMEWSVFHCANSAKGTAPEFVAIWEPSVTYNANGGSGSMSTDYLEWNESTLWGYNSYKAKSCGFTKSGASFTGWNTKADGSGTAYAAGAQLGGQRTNSDPITLYAQWSDGSSSGGDDTETDTTKDWTLTFDPNGGTMVGASSYGINTGDVYADVIGDMPQATRSGYTLTGWYNEKYNYTLNMGDYFAVSEDATFVAQWTKNAEPEVETYTLTLDPNGGTMPSGYSTSYEFEADEKFVDVIGGYPVPTRSGYTFEGWRRTDYSADFWVGTWGTQPYTFGYDVTVKAEWTKNVHTCSYTSKVTTQPTCTEDGVRTYTCSECGASYTEAIAAIGHSYSSVVTAPTCTMYGYTTYTCANCGDSYVADTVAALGHSYVADVTDATCTTDGETVYTCSVCGDSYTEAIEATGHSYDAVVTEPTCTEDGYTTYTCTVCKYSYTDDIVSAKGHSYYTNVTAPTCTAQGYTTYTCSVCSDSYVAEYTDPIEHLFYDYVSNNDATCTENGTMTAYCEYGCGTTDTIADMGSVLGHSYNGAVTEPTCTENGYTIYTCERCGDSYTESIPAKGHSYNGAVTEPTCTENGYTTYTCSVCGDSYKADETAALGHSFGDWVETTAPTTTTFGVETRTCANCSETETREIPMLSVDGPVVADVTNYTVTINGVNDVKEIRFAPGHWTTGSEVREAEGSLTLSAALVKANTDENGLFSYDVSWACEYTFWIRNNDGSSYFLYADTSEINTYLSADGLRLTVTDMKTASYIKDMWIAQGSWTTYSEIKNNVADNAKYQATTAKLSHYYATNDFTYTCLAPGAHTVLIRYIDGTTEVHYIELTVDVPTFDVNGLQVTIGNIPGVRLIRTAYGEYSSVSEIKTASGLRNFNNKTAIKDAEQYMIQYRNAGVVTITVEYNTGYQHVEHVTITPKQPTVVQNGNSVTFADLDGLVMVRYALGVYKTASQIKAAAGSVALKEDSIVDGVITVSGLAEGTYTFCVQYDDESYNYYVITVE